MAYSPKTWALTDPITPTDLNRIETGIDALDTRTQAGIATSPATTAGGTATITITFPNTFSSNPAVTALPASSTPQSCVVTLYSISTTTAVLKLYTSIAYASGVGIHWIAVGS